MIRIRLEYHEESGCSFSGDTIKHMSVVKYKYPFNIRHLLGKPMCCLLVFTHHYSRGFTFFIVSYTLVHSKHITFYTRHLFTEIALSSNTSSPRVRYSVLTVLYYLRDPCTFRDRTLYCDNKSAISIAHNLVQHDRTKYIEVDRHFIKEKLDNVLICTPYVSTQNQLAYILTKGLSYINFKRIISKLGMENIYSPA